MAHDLFRSSRVRLAGLRKEEAADMVAWSEDGLYLRLQDTNLARPQTAEQIAADLDKLADDAHNLVFGIRTVEDDVLIGTVGFFDIEWSNGVAWLGMGIGARDYWDRGLGSEALGLALRYAFQEMNLHRVTLTVLGYNMRAIRLYQKFGFQHEGTFREFGQRDGKRYDMLLYGLLRREWRAHNQGGE
ncbi:MAG: GNAT family N-acetyltransferase [Anaerolineae bacterium]|nr:GNAT family N-acetyltransferase [Anaerolineae bacterium]